MLSSDLLPPSLETASAAAPTPLKGASFHPCTNSALMQAMARDGADTAARMVALTQSAVRMPR